MQNLREWRMLGILFGFNMRVGRLQYFLATIGLGIVMLAVLFAIAAATAQGSPQQMLTALGSWQIGLTVIFFIWLSLMLQSMRFRDIGWDPVCVVPLWIAIMVVDHLVAIKVPGWALTMKHSGTVVGALINLGLGLALLFWPSGHDQAPADRTYDPPSPRRAPASALDARIARMSRR